MRRRPFEVTLAASVPEKVRTAVLVVGAFADGSLPPVSQRVDTATGGRLTAILKLGDLGKRAGATLLLHNLQGLSAERILLVSLGSRDLYGDKTFRDALNGAARALAAGTAADAAVTLADIELPGRSLAWRLRQASQLLIDGAYRFIGPMTTSAALEEQKRGAHRVVLLISGPVSPEDGCALRRGQAIADGMALARDLGNLPGNLCNPPFLAKTARALGREFGFEVEVLERDDMKELGMGAALAAGPTSGHPCKFIVMHYVGGESAARPIVLVGKGVTSDMCGAAAVFGAIKVVARLRLALSVVGIVPAIEILPGGNATRPGDVVTSMSGQTIEIVGTDAEGRLALADALTYAERFDPVCMIDIAALTGACVMALGHVASGLLTNDDQLASDLVRSGVDASDRAWRLPMFDEYQDQLRSNVADLRSLDGPPAGTITVACFLRRFVGAYEWAHLDIAGTGTLPGNARAATGRPVPLLSEFLLSRVRLTTPQPARPPRHNPRRAQTDVSRGRHLSAPGP